MLTDFTFHRTRPRSLPHRMVLAKGISSLLFLSGCAVPMTAAELVMTDINLGIESLPTVYDFTLRDGNSTKSGSNEFDFGFGLSGRAVYAFSSPGASGAFFVGGALALGAYTYENSGTYNVAMGRLVGGYAYSFDDHWTAEVSPWAGIGYGQMFIPGNGISSDHDVAGQVYDYGANLGVTYAASSSWLLSARVGWQIAEADLAGEGLELNLQQSGPTVFLGVIYRFGGLPPSIR